MGHTTKKRYNKNSKKLFKNSIIERLSKSHISVPISILTVYGVVIAYWGISDGAINLLNLVWLFPMGVLTFTLAEYLIHRYVFHMLPDKPIKEKIAYNFHGVHHDYPNDKERLAMSPIVSFILSTVLFFLFRLVIGDYAFAFVPGFLIGYCAYLGVHYIVHAFRAPKNIFRTLWVHHGIHHFKDPERAYGVSSPLWDFVFGTMPR